MLQNAESFEIWFLNPELKNERVGFVSEYLDSQANQVNKKLDEGLKKKFISVFLKDVENGGEISRCWIPHHGIKAIYNNQTIEIAICFMCGQCRGQILDEKFFATFPNENDSESKVVFDEIIAEINYAN